MVFSSEEGSIRKKMDWIPPLGFCEMIAGLKFDNPPDPSIKFSDLNELLDTFKDPSFWHKLKGKKAPN